MGVLFVSSSRPYANSFLDGYWASAWRGRKCSGLFSSRTTSPDKLCSGFGAQLKVFSSRNSRKKMSKAGETSRTRTLESEMASSNDYEFLDGDADIGDHDFGSSNHNLDTKGPITSPSRTAVLQACTVTSGLILALGSVVRQVSHVASTEGWLQVDSTELSFTFEMWHLELIAGLVILISSCRYMLLKTWKDFAESSEAANQQVLGSLQPLDYVVVACLPGISEELLFRGGLLPLFGLNWESALAVGALFGCLHLGSGRRYSFAVWATYVGFIYGMATILSSSIIVPMVSHSLNNLIGGFLWRYAFTSKEKFK